jgi:DNA ligase-1
MFISPMLLEKSDTPFNSSTHIFEPKIDGHRLILTRMNGETRLWTHYHTECTRQYPELWDVPIDGDVTLDGEVCCLDPETGAIDFELVMERFQLKKHDKIQAVAARRPVQFVVFDILQHNGKDLRKLPLMKRKSILQNVLRPNKFFSNIMHIDDNGEDLYRLICERKMEGIVAKQKDSSYVSRRSHNWLKIVRYEEVEVFISGYRKEEFGWLAQVEENGKKRSVGIIELGVPPKHRKEFYGISKNLVTGEDKNFVYIEPCIKAKVKIRNWTRNGMLRTPSFVDFVL